MDDVEDLETRIEREVCDVLRDHGPDGHVDGYAQLTDLVLRYVAAERERWRSALAYAVEEADGWCDEARGAPVPGERMAEVRRMLSGD